MLGKGPPSGTGGAGKEAIVAALTVRACCECVDLPGGLRACRPRGSCLNTF